MQVMEILENKTHPWQHPYYSRIRDMYHPFLYHNHLYCELKDETLAKLLSERENYIRTIESGVIDIQLTDAERNWVHYLRDCCLFEVHRRKYKCVLVDLMRKTNRNHPSNADWEASQLPAHCKVSQWLASNERGEPRSFDPIRDRDEYPERLENRVKSPRRVQDEMQSQPAIKREIESSRFQEGVILGEDETKYPKLPEGNKDDKLPEGNKEYYILPVNNTKDSKTPELIEDEPEYPKLPEIKIKLSKLLKDSKDDPKLDDDKPKCLNRPREITKHPNVSEDTMKYSKPPKDKDSKLQNHKPEHIEPPKEKIKYPALQEDKKKYRELPTNKKEDTKFREDKDEVLDRPNEKRKYSSLSEDQMKQPEDKKNYQKLQEDKSDYCNRPREEIKYFMATDLEDTEEEDEETEPRGLILWPDYPRELYETHPELFEPRTIRSLGRLMSDPEYIQRRVERRHELQLLAERREKALEEFNKRKAAEKERKEKEDRVKKDLQEMWEKEERRREEERKKEFERRRALRRKEAERINQVLTSNYVETAINNALNRDYNAHQERSTRQDLVGEQATTSKLGRMTISWDEIMEAIDIMNRDLKQKMAEMAEKNQGTVIFHIAPSNSASNDEANSLEEFLRKQSEIGSHSRVVDEFDDSDTWFPEENVEGYIQPGTYTVPKTSSITHIRKGGFQLINLLEEQGDDKIEVGKKEVQVDEEETEVMGKEETEVIGEEGTEVVEEEETEMMARKVEVDGEETEIEDEASDKLVFQQLYPKSQLEFCQGDTSQSGQIDDSENSNIAPLVPEFSPSDDTESTSSSLPSVIPAGERQASKIDDKEDSSVTSDDLLEFESIRIDLNSSIVDTEPPEDFFAPSPPPMTPKESEESTISESDIASTLPEIEPDFINLPLPETPDDMKK